MDIPTKTKERIINALIEGWSFRYPKSPSGDLQKTSKGLHYINRGSIYISDPKTPDGWVAYKSDTKHWLDDCLDEAGVKSKF